MKRSDVKKKKSQGGPLQHQAITVYHPHISSQVNSGRVINAETYQFLQVEHVLPGELSFRCIFQGAEQAVIRAFLLIRVYFALQLQVILLSHTKGGICNQICGKIWGKESSRRDR